MKTWQMWMVVVGVAFAALARPVQAGTAEVAGPWGPAPSAAPGLVDSPVWGQPAPDSRRDAVLDGMLQTHPQPGIPARIERTSAASQSSQPGSSNGEAGSSDSIKAGLFIQSGSAKFAAGRSSGSADNATGNVGAANDAAVRAIPAPTAISLFPLGAAIAGFAAWRMGRRRAPLLASVRATFRRRA